jgi:hypothetical protein
VLERREVRRRLAARQTPTPLLLDRGAEAELEDGVEGAVGLAEDGPQDLVEELLGDRSAGIRPTR